VSRVSEHPHRHLAELRRRLRQTGGRGRKLRGLLELLRPYRGRTLLMLGALLLSTAAALAPRRWPSSRSIPASCRATWRR
jgi:hypothetical protein